MKINEVYVELGIKKSQDFQSCSNTVGLRAELADDDDPVSVIRELQQRSHELLLKRMLGGAERAAPAVPGL